MIDKTEGAGTEPTPTENKLAQNIAPFLSPVNTPPFKKIKLFPQLSASALKTGRDREFFFWLELRALDQIPQGQSGDGKINISEALQALVPRVYTKRTFYRLLNLGNRLFWRTYQGREDRRIQIFKTERVARALGVYYLERVREAQPEKFKKTRQGKRAILLASYHKSEGSKNNPIRSRAKIQKDTGLSEQTQRNLEKIAGVKKKPVFVHHYNPQGNLVPMHRAISFKFPWLLWQVGNIFSSPLLPGRKGSRRKINRFLGSHKVGEPRLQRFFFSPKPSPGVTVHPEPFLWLKAEQKWCRIY